MKFETFVDKCVAIFQRAKKKKALSSRVKRGRAGSCSSECEDLLALCVSDEIPEKYTLLVDYPITVRREGQKRAETIYPDIAVISGNVLHGVIEIKNDLGYMSEDWAKKSHENLGKLQKANSISYKQTVNVGAKEPKIGLNVAGQLKQAVVVISGENAHGRMDALQKQHKCFILMPQHHPNHCDASKDVQEIIKNPGGWIALNRYLADNYK
jgi:hypothetical protein